MKATLLFIFAVLLIPDHSIGQSKSGFDNEVAIEQIIHAIKRICRGAALTAGMPEDKLPEVRVTPGDHPPVINDTDLYNKIHEYSGSIKKSLFA